MSNFNITNIRSDTSKITDLNIESNPILKKILVFSMVSKQLEYIEESFHKENIRNFYPTIIVPSDSNAFEFILKRIEMAGKILFENGYKEFLESKNSFTFFDSVLERINQIVIRTDLNKQNFEQLISLENMDIVSAYCDRYPSNIKSLNTNRTREFLDNRLSGWRSHPNLEYFLQTHQKTYKQHLTDALNASNFERAIELIPNVDINCLHFCSIINSKKFRLEQKLILIENVFNKIKSEILLDCFVAILFTKNKEIIDFFQKLVNGKTTIDFEICRHKIRNSKRSKQFLAQNKYGDNFDKKIFEQSFNEIYAWLKYVIDQTTDSKNQSRKRKREEFKNTTPRVIYSTKINYSNLNFIQNNFVDINSPDFTRDDASCIGSGPFDFTINNNNFIDCDNSDSLINADSFEIENLNPNENDNFLRKKIDFIAENNYKYLDENNFDQILMNLMD